MQVKLIEATSDFNWMRSTLNQLVALRDKTNSVMEGSAKSKEALGPWPQIRDGSNEFYYLPLCSICSTDRTDAPVISIKPSMCGTAQCCSSWFSRGTSRICACVSRLDLWRTAPCGLFQSYVRVILCCTNSGWPSFSFSEDSKHCCNNRTLVH